MKITKVAIYTEPAIPQTHPEEIASFIQDSLGIECTVCGKISADSIPELCRCVVNNPYRPLDMQTEGSVAKDGIAMHDGICVQRAFAKAIPQEMRRTDWMHIIFTTMLVGTYDPDGLRYHSRALIGANPAVISTTGIIEAPAKPREYYISQGTGEPYEGWNEWIEYGDERLAYAAKGYAMQALSYYATGEAFCTDPDCILYNAHWQRELVRAHVESGLMCKKHHDAVLDAAGGSMRHKIT